MSRYIKPAHKEAFHFDGLLALIIAFIVLLGFVMVASSSLHWAVSKEDGSLFDPLFAAPLQHEIVKQLIHIGLGVLLGFYIANTPMRKWERRGSWLFILGLLLLALVLNKHFGFESHHSRRWLQIFGQNIQVSELVKFFSVIYMAGYVTRHHQSIRKSSG